MDEFTQSMNLNSKCVLRLVLIGMLSVCSLRMSAAAGVSYQEPWRPQFHFTPSTNWMNDPNGMVYYDGEYHLFYQFNPWGDRWGHMSWGHAVTRDLVHWEHLPIALYEEGDVMIFSGSAVIDWKNTSGFGQGKRPPMVAIYTGHDTKRPLQNQHLAFSNDRGRTWTKYSGNPVLDIGDKDFRDPKVFWHEETQRWIMVVSWPTHRQIRIYNSTDLKHWVHSSDFGPAGSVDGIWECPDLLRVPTVDSKRNQKWVLIVNVGSGAPAGGSGCQYFVGEFDGSRFSLDSHGGDGASTQSPQAARWLDWGPDCYAAVTWNGRAATETAPVLLGWMSNWEYANDAPTSPWRSAMTIPRSISLKEGESGWDLVQSPVAALRSLRSTRHGQRATFTQNGTQGRRSLSQFSTSVQAGFECLAQVQGSADLVLSVALKTGDQERVEWIFDFPKHEVRVDRTRSGRVDFNKTFQKQSSAPLRGVKPESWTMRWFVDASSMELFLDDGHFAKTVQFFPTQSGSSNARSLELEVRQGSIAPIKMEVWELKSAWPR